MDARLLFGDYQSEPDRWETLSDRRAMAIAMQEAFRGVGRVSPNPLVGCVILDSQNRFLAKGYHARLGDAHAEIHALAQVSEAELKDARVFVTLEPCAHEGRTPSCAKTMARLPVREVIYGLQDPNPLVQGKGADILKSAGKRVTLFTDLLDTAEKEKWQTQLQAVCEHFLWNFEQKKVFVSLKVASSIDGQLAMATGESKWITGPVAREYAHYLRGSHDAIAVGKETIALDNPSLDIRDSAMKGLRRPVVIFDSTGETLKNKDSLKIFSAHKPEEIFYVVSRGADVHDFPEGQLLRFDKEDGLSVLLQALYSKGIRSLLVEGGAGLLSSFIREGEFQRLYVFQAPLIMGAKSGKAWSEQVTIASLSDGLRLKHQSLLRLGEDLLMTWRKT